MADVVYEGVRDGVEHALNGQAVVKGLHGAGAEREGPWRERERERVCLLKNRTGPGECKAVHQSVSTLYKPVQR